MYLQLTVTYQLCHRPKKKLFESGQIYKKDAHCSKNDFLVFDFFSVRLLGSEIWSVSCTYGHFDVCDLMYAKDLRDFCEPDSGANQ